MRRLFLIATVGLCLLAAACGGLSSPKIDVTIAGKTTSYALKEGVMYKLQQGSTGPDGKAQYQMHLATFEITKGGDVSKPLTENGQAVLSIEVFDKTGTTRDSEPTPTTFPAKSNDFAQPSFGSFFISYFDDGKLVRKTPSEFTVETKDKEGAVKFTGISGDIVKGEVDVKLGDKVTLKGTFTAKIVGKDF